MPWTQSSFAKHNKSLSDDESQQAATVANAVLAESGDEGKAIRIASYRAKRKKRRKAESKVAQGYK